MVYLYCITDACASNLTFLNSEKTHSIDFKQFSVVTSDPKDFKPESAQCIMEHHTINDRILRKGFIVLPFAYGTVIPLNEVTLFARERREVILKSLEKFRGKVEMGIKAVLPKKADRSTEEVQKRLGDTPGHRYLSRQIEKYAPLLAGTGAVQNLRGGINKYLAPICCDFKMKVSVKQSTLINMAFLIKQESETDFIGAFRQFKADYPECKFMVSGPWPAYNFIRLAEKEPPGEGDAS